MAEKLDFENALKSLEEIIAKLEKGECSLEDSITLFENGMENVKKCRAALKQAEVRISNLSEKGE